MQIPSIVLKVNNKQFAKLVELGKTVLLSMTGNLNFSTPTPTLTTMSTAIDALVNAIAKWGPKGNRGSHADYVLLCHAATDLHLIIKEMAQYVSNTAEQMAGSDYVFMRSVMAGSGFTLGKTKEVHTRLQGVENFRSLSSRAIEQNQVKLKWSRPLNTARPSDVSNYLVYRSLTPMFSSAVLINTTTNGEFIDTNTSDTTVVWYYWIVACNPAGQGVSSEMVSAMVRHA